MFRVWILPALALGCAVPWAAVRLVMRTPARRAAIEALLAGYIGTLLYVVFYLSGSAGPNGAESVWASINLVPGRTIVEIVRDFPRLIVLQLLDNVVLFVPLGFLLPTLSGRARRFGRTAAVALGVSLGIELVQLGMLITHVSHRRFDVDDVVLNVTGACLGHLTWKGVSLSRSALPPLWSTWVR